MRNKNGKPKGKEIDSFHEDNEKYVLFKVKEKCRKKEERKKEREKRMKEVKEKISGANLFSCFSIYHV